MLYKHNLLLLLLIFTSQLLIAQNDLEVSQPTSLASELKIQELNEISQKHALGISKQTYFAKNFRIIKVNVHELLNDESGELTLQAFERQEPLRLSKSSLEKLNEYQSVWSGSIENTTIPDELKRALPPELAERGMTLDMLHKSLTDVRINLVSWDINKRTGEAISPAQRPKLVSAIPNRYPYEDYDLNALQSIWTRINVDSGLGERTTYYIEPLEGDPRYHVFYEEDPEKEISLGLDPESALGKEHKRRYQEYMEFLRQVAIAQKSGGE